MSDHKKILALFSIFLNLGLTSFGGPIAHLGYFREEFVVRRKWLTDHHYSDLLALCQFLPGPTSSQVGFLIGLHRGGFLGAVAAWIGFTLPSACLMFAFASGLFLLRGHAAEAGLHGFKLVAIVIVAQAVWGMARNLTPDLTRVAIAILAASWVMVMHSGFNQVAAISFGAIAGLIVCSWRDDLAHDDAHYPVTRRIGATAIGLFFALLILLPLIASRASVFEFADIFYRAGAFVFGGGHVVLPLLERDMVARGFISSHDFLAGYGVTQAMPGPLFTFAAYLGALAQNGPGGLIGALIALIMIFLPGLLLVIGIAPFWNRLRHVAWVRAALAGANAAVVGILCAALYYPVWTSAVFTGADFALVALGLILLIGLRLPPWIIVLLLPVGSYLASVVM